jgi:hypothetical protein
VKTAALLRAAADALDAGEDPFSTAFLTANDVTFDQCMNLAQQLAIGARIVARGITQPTSVEGQAMLSTMARKS